MREYLFTEAEVECLVEWLETGRETSHTTKTLSRIRNAYRLAVHIELMALALRKLEQEGRLIGRMRLPPELASRASSLSVG